MQVRSGLTRARTSPSDQGTMGSRELRKSEHIDDIFNHQPIEEKERRSARVHLSHASRSLSQQFKKRVQKFLKENSEVAKNLDAIELPGEGLGEVPPERLALRRFSSYLQWLNIKEQKEVDDNGLSEQEAPYIAIHAEKKDDLIKELFTEQQEQRQALQQQRKKNAPNYYYLVYPETYSFN